MNSLFGKIVVLALLLITAGFLYLQYFTAASDALSAPTDFGANASQYAIDISPNPLDIAEMWQNADGDATDLYQRLDKHIKEHVADLESFAKSPSATHPGRPYAEQALQLLIDASVLSQGDVYKPRMNLLINYNSTPDESLQRLELLNKVAYILAAEAEKQSRISHALDIHQGLFTLGARMYAERYSIPQLLTAIDLMSSSQWIARIREPYDEFLFEQCSRFFKKLNDFSADVCEPVAAEILKLDASPGDMAALIDNADRLWKIQAVLSLGRLRFTAPVASDRKAIPLYLKNLDPEDNPPLRAAIDAALNLTSDDLHKMK